MKICRKENRITRDLNSKRGGGSDWVLNFASKTPMLIVHGQEDYRVDVSEGFQAYTALRLRGLPGKFLYFPNEGHGFYTEPHQREFYTKLLGFLSRHLGGAAAK